MIIDWETEAEFQAQNRNEEKVEFSVKDIYILGCQ